MKEMQRRRPPSALTVEDSSAVAAAPQVVAPLGIRGAHAERIAAMKMQGAAVPSALAVEVSSAVQAAVDSALSKNTRRAYAAGFAAWSEFAETRGWPAMPPMPEQVAAWAVAMADAGLSPPSIRCRLAALAFACRVSPSHLRPEHPPRQSEMVQQTLRGIVRVRNHRPRQSAPVTPDISGC